MATSEIVLNGVFYVLAIAAVAGSVAVATSRNIVRSAFALLAVLFAAAALYALMKADFIAAAQVLIYVGGILVLIIFAVMLTHRITDVKISNESTPGPAAFCACLCLLFSLAVIILVAHKDGIWGRNRDSEGVRVKVGQEEVTLLQYQADGQTGLARGGSAFETSAVVAVMTPKPPAGASVLEVKAVSEIKPFVKESDKGKAPEPKAAEAAAPKKADPLRKEITASRPVSPDVT